VVWRACFFAVAGLAALSPLFQVPWVVVATIMLALAVIVAVQLMTSRVYRTKPDPAVVADAMRIDGDIRRTSFGFLLVGLLSTSTQYLIVLLAALVLTAVDTAHFFNAFKLMQVLALSSFAVNFVLAPRLRGLAAARPSTGTRDFATLSKVCITSAWFNTAFALAGILVFAVAGHWMLSLFGPEYAGDKGLLLLLCMAAVINGATGTSGFVLVMFDLAPQFNLISAVSMAIGALVAVGLGLHYGLTGFAAGYVVWVFVQNLSIATLCWVKLGVNATILGVPRFSVMRQKT
jgi:O-antigen/teichoic acid export membrane protein